VRGSSIVSARSVGVHGRIHASHPTTAFRASIVLPADEGVLDAGRFYGHATPPLDAPSVRGTDRP
jgi:hypothetical protein